MTDSKYTISGTISNDKVTIDEFKVNNKDVMATSELFKDDANKNIENIKKDNIKKELIRVVKGEVDENTIADNNTRDKPVYDQTNLLGSQKNSSVSVDEKGADAVETGTVIGQGAGIVDTNGGGLFRSPSANLKLAMNNPFATAISSSNNIARDMLTNTVSKTLKTATRSNNATKRFRRFFKTKRRNSNKKARKYTRYHK